MKRKIFSKLLMVALVIAAVGSFVSCKDYDDDINNLQKQIDTKAALSELTALQSTLDSKIAAAQSAAAAAQATADAAATKTALADLKSALETAIADAKKAGTDAGTQAGQAIVAANKAQETADAAAAAAKKAADDAEADLAAALVAINETFETKEDAAAKAAEATKAINEVKDAIQELADAAFTKAEAEELKAELDGLKESLESSIDEKIAAAIAELDNASASVAAIWTAITGIELVQSWSKYTAPAAGAGIQVLNFQYGHVGKNAKFGDNEGYEEASKVIEYTEGDSIKVQNFVLVRVNPANAKLKKEDILLINSKGEALDDYVEVLDPIKYTGLLTRGTTLESGIYQIPFQLKTKDVDVEELKDAVAEYNTDGTIKRNVLFAVAVNNTQDAAAQRYVNTTFDLTAAAGKYVPATAFTFTVNNEAFANLKNRWDGAKVVSEKGQQSTKPENAELAWGKDATNKTVLPVYEADQVKQAADNSNKATYNVVVESAAAETRSGNDALIVELNKPFTVKMNLPAQIDYYYVLFDKQSAIESAPSEWNAWSKYEVEGLGEMKQANEELELTIKTDKAQGDYIGFRVYAVNYDGTLADPDGRAFYVKVGDITRGTVSVSGSWTASVATATVGATKAALTAANVINLEDNTGTIAIDGSKFENLALAAASGTVTIDATTYANGVRTAATDRTLYYVLLGSDGKAAKNWKDITAIKVGLKTAGDWVDYAAANTTAGTPEYGKIGFTIEGYDPDDATELINTLNVTVTKSLLTTGTEPTYMPTYGPVGGVLTIWMQPESTNAFAAATVMNARPTVVAAADKDAAYATFGEADMATYVKDAGDYVFEFVAAGEAKYSAKSGRYAKDAVANVEVDGATSTVLALAGPVLNNTATKVTYTKAASATASAIDGTSIEPAQTLEIAANSKYPSKIGDGKQYTLNIYETSEAISCPLPTTAVAQTIGLVAQSLKAKFAHDVQDTYQSYSLKEYMYTTALNAGANDWTKGVQTSKEYFISYADIAAGNFKMYPVNNHADGTAPASTETVEATFAGNINVAQPVLVTGTTALVSNSAFAGFTALIEGKNSVWTTSYTTLAVANYAYQGTEGLSDALAANNYTFYASFTSDVTKQEDYVQVRIHDTSNNLMFRVTPAGIGGASGVAPITDVPSHLTIKATDAFGNAVTILNEAVILKP